jgi:hypothetical protein
MNFTTWGQEMTGSCDMGELNRNGRTGWQS